MNRKGAPLSSGQAPNADVTTVIERRLRQVTVGYEKKKQLKNTEKNPPILRQNKTLYHYLSLRPLRLCGLKESVFYFNILRLERL